MRGRPETRAIRLVAVTGYGQAEDRRRALAAGFDLHVTKPVNASMLDEMLGRAT
jgi:CheY-like chemotaxis protein